ncbi:J domain-containing protein [bacterium]|nr:J domain-containing protein [bacterium]NBX48952.1 J domain-containing protein [bacterium]
MTLYDDLGVSREASIDDIKKAYKKLAMKHHPDRGGDQEAFKKISHAYEVLSDQEKRRVYDMTGSDTGEPQGFPAGFAGGGPFDMFMNMFRGNQGAPGHRGDVQHTIQISLEEVYHGTEKHLKVETVKSCFACQSKCSQCQGSGQVQRSMGFMMMSSPCPACKGAGRNSSGCPGCNFTREKKDKHELSIKIEPGTQDGDHVVVPHLGEQARTPDEVSGNLIIQFRVKRHPVFLREGNDLLMIHKMSFTDSVNGTIFTVDHFSGPVRICTQDFGVIDPRQKYKIPGKGMKNGDLYVIFDLQYPPPTTRYVLTEAGTL